MRINLYATIYGKSSVTHYVVLVIVFCLVRSSVIRCVVLLIVVRVVKLSVICYVVVVIVPYILPYKSIHI